VEPRQINHFYSKFKETEMKKLLLIAVLFMFYIILPIETTYAQGHSDYTGNINIVIGSKEMKHDDWHPVDMLTEGSIQFDIRQYSWPVSICLAYSRATDSENIDIFGYGTKLTLTTQEFDIGVKKIFSNNSGINFALAGGLNTILATAEVNVDYVGDYVQDDKGIGMWVGSELYYTFLNHYNIGLNVKYSTASVNFDSGSSVDVGGLHGGVLLGYHF
jgi:hypothetical protein